MNQGRDIGLGSQVTNLGFKTLMAPFPTSVAILVHRIVNKSWCQISKVLLPEIDQKTILVPLSNIYSFVYPFNHVLHKWITNVAPEQSTCVYRHKEP